MLSNATASDITKAYRLRSRELHPDKRSHFSNSQLDMIENASAVEANDLDEELERVRQAYDILKDDRTRCGGDLLIPFFFTLIYRFFTEKIHVKFVLLAFPRFFLS